MAEKFICEQKGCTTKSIEHLNKLNKDQVNIDSKCFSSKKDIVDEKKKLSLITSLMKWRCDKCFDKFIATKFKEFSHLIMEKADADRSPV